MKTMFRYLCSSLLMLALAYPVFAADDAMDLAPLPAGTNLFITYYNSISSDASYADGSKVNEDFNLDGRIGIFRGAFYYKIGGFTALTDVVQPFGSTSARTTLPGETSHVHLSSPSGLGDFVLHQAVWLINDPASQFYFAPDLFITMPTGEYDHDKAMNLGGNRWAFRPGFGIVKGIGSKGTLVQLRGSVEFYTKNDEYLPAKFEQKKDPVYEFQSFLIQFLDPGTFLALEYNYTCGGETKLDGVKQDDETKTHAMGFTVMRMITANTQLIIKYKKDVDVENGPKTDTLGLRLAYLFPPSDKD
jgi:hypothetical protein